MVLVLQCNDNGNEITVSRWSTNIIVYTGS